MYWVFQMVFWSCLIGGMIFLNWVLNKYFPNKSDKGIYIWLSRFFGLILGIIVFFLLLGLADLLGL